MPKSDLQTLRQQARRGELPREEVEAIYRGLIEDAHHQAERRNGVRQLAWHLLVGHDSGSAPFWRHGFAKNYGKRVERHDYTIIPGYDEIHDSVAREYPEYAGDDGEYRLFDFLFSPYEKLPSRAELYAEAMDIAQAMIEKASEQGEPDYPSDWDEVDF